MALRKSKDIPEDAVILDEQKAIEYVWDLISEWKPPSETWALRNGSTILGGINAVCGMFINSFFRRKLKLGDYGFYASAIPLTLLPGVFTMLFHRHLVSTKIMLQDEPLCPICIEVRSAAVQTCYGLLYPMILAPSAALMLANRYNTARVPHLKEGASVMFSFLRKTVRPYSGTLVTMLTVQLIGSSIITYFEISNHVAVSTKLMEIERKLLPDLH